MQFNKYSPLLIMHGALTPKLNELQNIPKNGGAQIAQLA